MKHLHYFSFAVILLSASSQAQTIKEGLWEVKSLPNDDLQAEKKVADTRKQFTNMPVRNLFDQEAAKNAVKVSPEASSLKICITPEMAKHADLNGEENDTDCKQNKVKTTDNVVKFSLVCKGLGEIAEGENTIISASKIVSTITYKLPNVPVRTHKSQANFLSSDCGNIK